MKICPVCKAECSDSDKFCTVCGSTLSDTASAGAAPERPAEEKRPEPRPVPVRNVSENGLRLKELAGSKLVCTIAIALTLIVLLAIVSTFTVPRAIAGYVDDIADLLDEYDLGDIDLSDVDLSGLEEAGIDISDIDLDHIDIGELIDGSKGAIKNALSNAGSLTSAISANVKGILVAVSVWLIFFSARNAENPVCSGTGFVILLILRVLALIGTILLTLLLAAGGGFFISAAASGNGDSLPVAIVVTAVIAVILIISILYQIGLIRTLKRFNAETKGESEKGHVSGFAGFILVLKGIFAAIAVVLDLGLVVLFGSAAVPALLSQVATAVAFFGYSKFIFKAKNLLTMSS